MFFIELVKAEHQFCDACARETEVVELHIGLESKYGGLTDGVAAKLCLTCARELGKALTGTTKEE